MKNEKLYEQLEQYANSNMYPFHMPGHKRRMDSLPDWNFYAMDITEVDGFDNLHDAEEILKDTMKEIAAFRGADRTFMLVNGSTCGLLAGISACVKKGDEILVARNCHKAVYHAIYQNELKPYYIYPHFSNNLGINGGILRKNVEKMLISHPNIKAVVITSPTYEGVVSDVAGIAEVVHRHGIPLIVDQAHGAHFGMGNTFPVSALDKGADLVIESVHKTLPSLTQSALLHVKGDLVNQERLQKFLQIYQTSSPSYPMMAAIVWCMDYCKREQKKEFVRYEERLLHLRKRLERLPMITLFDGNLSEDGFGAVDYDRGKLVFGIRDQVFSGSQLYERLRVKYQLQMEMASNRYVIAMTSVMDTEEGFHRLYRALEEINDLAAYEQKKKGISGQETVEKVCEPVQNQMVYTPYETEQHVSCQVPFGEAKEQIAGDYVYLYPPGIPLIVPGEKYHQELLDYMQECMDLGLQVKGIKEGKVSVVSKKQF